MIRMQNMLHSFDQVSYDLNLTNKQVQKEIENIHRFWTKKGVDGFRYDAFYHYFGSENKNKAQQI
ncbi:alpha-amylase family glycosyl hydrolase [Mycoplasmopsis felis]|uniref:alpha-amylase family glycosyl hydrolase n=1 Tax=Mycoplasmopsis felis TaxID=33923 RepID=UPI003A5C895C